MKEKQVEQVDSDEELEEQEAATQRDIESAEAAALAEAFARDDAADEVEEEPFPYSEKQLEAMSERLGLKELAAKLEEVDRIRSSTDKVSGRLGSLYQTVDALRKQSTGKTSALQDAEVESRLSELKDDYPELAQSLVPILQKMATQSGGGFEPPKEPIFRIDPALAAQDELALRHEDWREVAASPEFSAWKKTLSPTRQRIADESWSVQAVSSLLDEYKAAKAKTAPPARKDSRRRLESAVAPRGVAKPSTGTATAEQAFLDGFKGA